LGVLEEAGTVRRVRSEGDKRRSYVQLRLDDPLIRVAVQPAGFGAVPRVLFVCTRNSARSQLALAYWRHISSVPAASAGTHPAGLVHPKAVTAGRRHGLRLSTTTAHVAEVQRPDDLVVAVCDNAHEELDSATPRLHWAIADPVRIDTDAAFDTAYAEISRRVNVLASTVPERAQRSSRDLGSSAGRA
jgi:protein-tyrosine-phosphatase